VLAVCHEALDHISQEQRRPHMLCAGFLLLVTAALVEHVRVCCRGSLGRARAASVTAARVSMCTRAVAALVERARVGPGCSMPVGPVVVARVGSCRRQVDVSGARRWAKRRHRQSPLLAEHVHVRRRGSG
jgi:hypothetical protein